MIGGLIGYLSFLGKIPNYENRIKILFFSNYYFSQRNLLSIIGLIVILATAFWNSKENAFPGYIALAPVIGTILIIISGPNAWLNKKILSIREVVFLGIISFPLYLWHWIIFSLARISYPSDLTYIDRLWVLIMALLLSYLTYTLIERPIKNSKNKKVIAALLIILMTVIGYVGLNTYLRDGLDFRGKHIQHRYPIELQKLAPQNYLEINLQRDSLQSKCNEINFNIFIKYYGLCPSSQIKEISSIVLWGDSYAEHLISGYVKYHGSKNSIFLIKSLGCPPVPYAGVNIKKECSQLYEKSIKYIVEKHPKQVVIAANWGEYNWESVEETIQTLKKVGISNINLIGPAPQWRDSLYKQLLISYEINTGNAVPYRMTLGLNNKFFIIDEKLKELSKKHNINYYSISDILCNSLGCITRFGETGDTLTSFDAGHFTAIASEYVVLQLKKHQ
jgi:hypothetical protein